MDDRDLELVRAFRAAEAESPPGLQTRIEEDLWKLILAEEASRAPAGMRRVSRWRGSLLRPLVAAGAAGALAIGVAVASDGGTGSTGPTSGSVREAGAGVLDGAATALFGQDGRPTASAGTAQVGSIDLGESGGVDGALERGPVVDADGQLDGASRDVVRSVPRDPATLRATIRAAASELEGADATDRAGFRMAMRWVVQPAAPTSLRASMLRSVEGMVGLDAVAMGTDVLGRRGIVVGHLDAVTGVREQWVLEPDRGTLLERRAYTTTLIDPACQPGTVTEHVAFDSDGDPVDSSDVPYLDWPQVVAACDPRPPVSG